MSINRLRNVAVRIRPLAGGGPGDPTDPTDPADPADARDGAATARPRRVSPGAPTTSRRRQIWDLETDAEGGDAAAPAAGPLDDAAFDPWLEARDDREDRDPAPGRGYGRAEAPGPEDGHGAARHSGRAPAARRPQAAPAQRADYGRDPGPGFGPGFRPDFRPDHGPDLGPDYRSDSLPDHEPRHGAGHGASYGPGYGAGYGPGHGSEAGAPAHGRAPRTPEPPFDPAATLSAPGSGRAKTRVLGFHAGDLARDPFAEAGQGGRGPLFPAGFLVVIDGPGRGAFFAVTTRVSSIGRSADQDVALDFGDESISREGHASVLYDAEQNRFFLGHGNKANVVRRNGMPVLATEDLVHGDVIRIGKTSLRFHAFCGADFTWEDGPVAPGRAGGHD